MHSARNATCKTYPCHLRVYIEHNKQNITHYNTRHQLHPWISQYIEHHSTRDRDKRDTERERERQRETREHRIARHNMTCKCIPWYHSASHRIASHRIASHRIARHTVTCRCIPWSHITSHRIASHRIASHCTTHCDM